MSSLKKFSISQKLASLLLVTGVSLFLIAFMVFAWTEPSSNPPNGNVAAPLNTGSSAQTKTGNLKLMRTSGANAELDIQSVAGTNNHWAIYHDRSTKQLRFWQGDNRLAIRADGKIGIGTVNLTATSPLLSVNGELDMMNHKIKNVKEIDPVFNINNKKYVTYMPDSIGQKVEVVGQSQLEGNILEIDLANQPEGSDLWLFWQIVDRKSIIPFVSPQSNASLYAYINGSKFIIKLREGESNTKFSYRLIATRLDHSNAVSNLYENQTAKYYIDINSLRK